MGPSLPLSQGRKRCQEWSWCPRVTAASTGSQEAEGTCALWSEPSVPLLANGRLLRSVKPQTLYSAGLHCEGQISRSGGFWQTANESLHAAAGMFCKAYSVTRIRASFLAQRLGHLSRQMGELGSRLQAGNSPPLVAWPVNLPFPLADPSWGRKWPGHALSRFWGKTEAKRGGCRLARGRAGWLKSLAVAPVSVGQGRDTTAVPPRQ